MGRTGQRTLVALFLAILALMPLATWVAPQSSVIPDEKRTRATLPDVAAAGASATTLFRGFEAWFEDHLGLRYPLVKAHHALEFYVLGQAPTDALMVGRDGWLFLAQDFALASYRAETPFAPEALDAWAALLTDLEQRLAARDARLLVVIAPNKSSIYEEKLPPGVARASARSRTDELVERLRETAVEPLDLRQALLEAKQQTEVYARRDTHWNGRGAYVAYRAILERLGGPEAPLGPDAVAERHPVRPGDLSRMVPLGKWLREPQLEVVPVAPRAVRLEPAPAIEKPSRVQRKHQVFEVADPRLPRALVYRDSFATALVPLLSEHFQRSVWRWERTIDPELVEAERPDVVIFEIAERYLMDAVPANAFRSGTTAGRISAPGSS